MPENLSHFEFLAVAGALVGGWIKFQSDYNRLSSRVAVLEADNSEFQRRHEAAAKGDSKK